MKIPSRIRVSYFEVEELMAKLLGKTAEFENDEIEDLEEDFYEKFEITADSFHSLVEHLIPLTHPTVSEITGTLRIGFADHENGMYIVKSEIPLDNK